MIKKQTSGRDDMIGKVALGATGVALAAGGVAAAVLLSNRKNRTTLKRVAGKTIKRIGTAKKAFESGAERFQSYQHRIGLGKGKAKLKVDLGKKKLIKRKG